MVKLPKLCSSSFQLFTKMQSVCNFFLFLKHDFNYIMDEWVSKCLVRKTGGDCENIKKYQRSFLICQ